MPALIDVIESGRAIADHRPWPAASWTAISGSRSRNRLPRADGHCFGLWGDKGAVHMAVLDETVRADRGRHPRMPGGQFPSVGRLHPPAIRLERTIRDLFGLEPMGLSDPRPWLDHGRWDLRHPLGGRLRRFSPRPLTNFLASEGEGLHQIPVGPVHAGIIEPGHFRFTASGETVVRLEERLGYSHKGAESLMRGASIDAAARLAGRVSGDSTVAYAFAFARAVEAALNIEVPPRAVWLRALMAELERLANHFGDIGAICNDAAFAMMHAYCGVLRERVLRTAAACFGHRLMMDCIVPGGVGIDLPSRGFERIRQFVETVNRAFPRWSSFTTTPPRSRIEPSGRDREVQHLPGNMAAAVTLAGHPGVLSTRASGFAYPPYDDCFSITTCLCSRRATSMREFGFASAKWRRAWRSSN